MVGFHLYQWIGILTYADNICNKCMKITYIGNNAFKNPKCCLNIYCCELSHSPVLCCRTEQYLTM